MRDALHSELRREHRRLLRDLTPTVTAAVAVLPLMEVDFAIKVVVSQNLLRSCAERAIAFSLPVGHAYFIELATRMAAYFLTALPPDDQEQAAMAVRAGLLPKLADMQAAGIVIETEWD